MSENTSRFYFLHKRYLEHADRTTGELRPFTRRPKKGSHRVRKHSSAGDEATGRGRNSHVLRRIDPEDEDMVNMLLKDAMDRIINHNVCCVDSNRGSETGEQETW